MTIVLKIRIDTSFLSKFSPCTSILTTSPPLPGSLNVKFIYLCLSPSLQNYPKLHVAVFTFRTCPIPVMDANLFIVDLQYTDQLTVRSIWMLLSQTSFNPNSNLNQNWERQYIQSETTHPTPQGTHPCLILIKLLTFQIIHQNISCLSILQQFRNCANFSVIQQPYNCRRSLIKAVS